MQTPGRPTDMQDVVFDKPYQFVPPYHGTFWQSLFQLYVGRYVNRTYGVERIETQGAELLDESIRAGHGIILASNHCRSCDPFMLAPLSRAVRKPFFIMASWHLFMQGRFMAWLTNRAGAFSIYREGMDRAAISAATDIIETAERPLIMFAEGVVSRTNYRLNALMDGVALIGRAAAKKRARLSPPGKVVIHPIGIRYRFTGDIATALRPALDAIETHLSWLPQRHLPLPERIAKLGQGLLCLKEVEYFGAAHGGSIDQRLRKLIDRILIPLEDEWCPGQEPLSGVPRIKRLRVAILPDMIKGDLDESERQRRWRQLADIYMAQQLSLYRPDYIRENPTPERLLEAVESFEEDLWDEPRVHRPLAAQVCVGRAIEVPPSREQRGGPDPVMTQLEEGLKELLGIATAVSADP